MYIVRLKWVKKPENLEVSVGKPVKIPCEAEGLPRPAIKWKKLGDKEEGLNSNLQFSAITQQDAGYYECTASNGDDNNLVARIKLNVLGKY